MGKGYIYCIHNIFRRHWTGTLQTLNEINTSFINKNKYWLSLILIIHKCTSTTRNVYHVILFDITNKLQILKNGRG